MIFPVKLLLILILITLFVPIISPVQARTNRRHTTPTPTKLPRPTVFITPSPTQQITPTQKQRINPICVSSHIDEIPQADLEKQTTLMQQAGVKWVRFDFIWDSIETSSGKYDWSHYDAVVDQVNSKGMRVIALIADWGVPTWKNQSIDPVQYGTFIQALATHFKGKISFYEIGNEPNLNNVSASSYTQRLIAGYDAIKAADPASKVISAGLALYKTDLSYIQSMYDNGAKDHFDYFGMHPYSWPFSPDENSDGWGFSILNNIKALMVKNGDSAKIIATEIGWPSTTASGGVTEATQAAFINTVYQNIEYKNFQYVPIACIYDFIDDGTDKANPENNFGILRKDYSQKPAFATLQQVRQDYNANFTEINP